MDAALLNTVEANRKTREQVVGQGMDVQEGQINGLLLGLEKMGTRCSPPFTRLSRSARDGNA